MNVDQMLSNIFCLIEKKSKDKYYILKFSFILVLSSWLLAFPSVFLSLKPSLFSPWQTVILKSNDLTNNLKHIPPYSWQAKKVFRLTIPVFMKLFRLSPPMIIIFQILVGYLIYVFSYKLTFRITKDAVQSSFLTAGIGFLYFGRAAFFDSKSIWFDGFSYFFLLMAMYKENVFSIFIYATLAAWNDERAFIALSLVFLFHLLENKNIQKLSIHDIFKINSRALTVVLAIVSYLLLRLLLQIKFNMHTPTDGANLSVLFNRTLNYIPIGALTFLEGFWLLIIFTLITVTYKKDYLFLILVAIPITIGGIISYCVTDITRSWAFMVIVLFILVNYLKKSQNQFEIRKILFACFLLSIIIPPIFVCPDWSINNWFPKSSFPYFFEHIRDFIKHRFL